MNNMQQIIKSHTPTAETRQKLCKNKDGDLNRETSK